jgi:hypothetical protein
MKRTASKVSFLLYASEKKSKGARAREFENRCPIPECRKGANRRPGKPEMLRGLMPYIRRSKGKIRFTK